MIDFIIKKYKEYKNILLYLVFGVLATIVNISVYYVAVRGFHIYYLESNAIAWIAAVIFAYLTNRFFVFRSNANKFFEIVREVFLFFSCRVISLGLDMAIMFVMIDLFRIHDLYAKIVCQIVVVLSNYAFSKIIIFRKHKVGI